MSNWCAPYCLHYSIQTANGLCIPFSESHYVRFSKALLSRIAHLTCLQKRDFHEQKIFTLSRLAARFNSDFAKNLGLG